MSHNTHLLSAMPFFCFSRLALFFQRTLKNSSGMAILLGCWVRGSVLAKFTFCSHTVVVFAGPRA